MSEKELQDQLIDLIKNETFVEAINNIESLDNAIMIDNELNTMPIFSIDHLLKRKYSISAQNVLESLCSYELISGDSIKNISLNVKERLFPDCLLFNNESNEIIVIENKTDSQTEREAITELFGYSQEIRNILPFISDFDINYILISTKFNTLLDHSVSSQVISSKVNILCLKPSITNNKLSFDIHFPTSWSNIGQNGLPSNSFVSYTIHLKKKADKEFAHLNIIHQALDLITFDANSNKVSGFCILWENGLPEFSDFDYGISIYVINSYVFLPNAIKLGFNLNSNSVLSKFILSDIERNGEIKTPNSLFRIANRAESLLNKYFEVEWGRNTTWEEDVEDQIYKSQRMPIYSDSWGIVGEFIRYYYYHPACQEHYFNDAETIKTNPQDPRISIQIINIITNNTLFKYGHFSLKNIFHFGLQLNLYAMACKTALETNENNLVSSNALLFWSNLPLLSSLKEIRFRVNDSKDFDINEFPKFTLYFHKEGVKKEYVQNLEIFTNWFTNVFLSNHRLHVEIFNIGYYYAPYFYNFLTDLEELTIKDEISSFSKYQLRLILNSLSSEDNFMEQKTKSLLNNLLSLNLTENVKSKAIQKLDSLDFSGTFADEIIEILDSFHGQVYHRLKRLPISKSIDYQWLMESAKNRFIEGHRYTAIEIASNGEIGLGEIEEPFRKIMGKLQSIDEIYLVKNPDAGLPIVLKKKWTDILADELT